MNLTKQQIDEHNERLRIEQLALAALTPAERQRRMDAKRAGKKSPIIVDEFKLLGLLTENEDHPLHPVSSSELKQAIRNDALAAVSGKEADAARVRVRVVSYRKRLIDPDNLCPKFHIDACRYAGFIKDDSAKEIELSVIQEKVNSRELERTEITIETP